MRNRDKKKCSYRVISSDRELQNTEIPIQPWLFNLVLIMVITAIAMVAYSGAFGEIDPQWYPYVAIALVSILLSELWRRNRRLPPGPKGLPIVGYYPFLGPSPIPKMKELTDTYGEIYSFRSLGGHLVIVLNGLPIIKEVLQSRGDEFVGRPLMSNLIEWIDDGLGISQAEGAPWKEQRKYFLQAAKPYGFGKMECEPLIHELVQSMITDLREIKGKSFKPLVHVSHITANVIGTILFQKRFQKNDPEFQKMVTGMNTFLSFFAGSRVFVFGAMMKLLIRLSPEGKSAIRTKGEMMQFSKKTVDEHRRTFDENNLRDFVDSFLNQIKKFESKIPLLETSFDMERLYAIAMDNMMEGTESVGLTIQCCLFKLSEHEECQKKAQIELDSVVGRDRLPSWSDRQNLPFLEAFILELLRTSSPFFISTYYSNFEETYIRGYRIPKRSIIVASLRSVSDDYSQFPQPSQFRPERFLGPDGKRTKQENPIPFGTGKRACIGESLAQMEIFNVIAGVLQNFTIHPSSREGELIAVPR